jgi:hypothetical protein
VKAKGRAKKRLQRDGRARIRLEITYTPSHASGGTQARKLRLKETIH